MKAIHLRTEYLEKPLGLGITSPRFYWQCEGGMKQTAYQIIAKVGEETVWNSGKVASSSMTHIAYAGRPLKSRECVCWSIKLWDENGMGGEVASSWFEMGLLDASDWQAKWIKPAADMGSIAPLFAQAIANIHNNASVTHLFEVGC